MKQFGYFILTYSLWVSFVFLCVSFILFDFNASHWDTYWRAVVAFFGGLIGFYAAIEISKAFRND